MLYAKLVARIAEVTRTLVQRGKTGGFEQNSTIFSVEADVHEVRAAQVRWLKIAEGDARGTYQVVRVFGSEVHVAEPFLSSGGPIAWELHDGGVAEEDVRKVLRQLPEVLMECEEGEQVKTYLGVIKLVRRRRKRVKDPQGRWTFSPERLQARLRPGKRLQRLLEGASSEPSTSSSAQAEDEDPPP